MGVFLAGAASAEVAAKRSSRASRPMFLTASDTHVRVVNDKRCARLVSDNYKEEVIPIDRKRVKSLLESLETAGWKRTDTKSGWIVYPPDKNLSGVAIHKTPSDHRAWKNLMAELRRRGFNENQ